MPDAPRPSPGHRLRQPGRLPPRERLRRRALLAILALPLPVLRTLFGEPPRNDRGVSLDAQAHVMARLDARIQPPLTGATPRRARAALKSGLGIVSGAPRAVDVRELSLEGLPARLYLPRVASSPLLVFLHGGGWVAGDLDSHDPLCRRLAAARQWRDLSVAYRLAPEHPFPAGLDAAVAAFRHARTHAADWGGDPARVAIGGDSAGGNLAAAACQRLRDEGHALPWLQLLAYPAVDQRCQAESHRLFAEGYLLGAGDVAFYRAQYAAPDPLDPRASPLLAADLTGLPPAVVLTAGFDPLRDEGEAYARALRLAGVPTTWLDAADLLHGFLNMDGVLPAAERELTRLEEVLLALA